MSRRYPAMLAGLTGLLGAATAALIAGLVAAWERLSTGPGPDVNDDAAMEAWQREIEPLNAFVQLGYPAVGSLVLAALIPAIGAIVLLAVRAQRASASATASRDASVAS